MDNTSSMTVEQILRERERQRQLDWQNTNVGGDAWWNAVLAAAGNQAGLNSGAGSQVTPVASQPGGQQQTPWSPPASGAQQQILPGYGIPGFETNPMVGGGSWEGTTWGGRNYTGLQEQPIPQTDVTNPNSPYYRPIYHSNPFTTEAGTTPGFSVNPAVPYQTSWYLQTYGGKPPPYINIHEQMGDAMQGVQAAKPGFNWASPQALSQLGGYGLPGGWTSMLGFTPGGANNG